MEQTGSDECISAGTLPVHGSLETNLVHSLGLQKPVQRELEVTAVQEPIQSWDTAVDETVRRGR